MIESLTKKQEEMLSVYRDKWIKIGLSTKPATKKETKDIINRFYKLILQKEPPKDIYNADGPADAWGKVVLLQEGKSIKTSKKKIREAAKRVSFVWPYMDGSFFVAPIAFYDYFRDVYKIDYGKDLNEKFDVWKDTSKLGLIYPFDDYCVVSSKPMSICVENERLHKDGGPAIEYADGTKVYALNGVRFSDPKLVIAPADKITKKDILSIQNADQRREVVRKLGIDRTIKLLGSEVIDKEDGYELLIVDIGDNRKRPYLKMLNPSIKQWHIEGVAPNIKTVKDALAYRNGLEEYVAPFALS